MFRVLGLIFHLEINSRRFSDDETRSVHQCSLIVKSLLKWVGEGDQIALAKDNKLFSRYGL